MDASSFYSKISREIPRILPAPLVKLCIKLGIVYKTLRMPQKKICCGALNPERTFYVIRLFPPASGFFADYLFILGYMRHAYEKGWIPVIDMENYENWYTQDQPVNSTRNVWEWIFQQPLDEKSGKRYSLSEVYQSKNVILANGSELFFSNKGDAETLQWQRKMAQAVPFSEAVAAHIEAARAKLFTQDVLSAGVIGAPIRGSDLQTRVYGHAIQATAEDMLPLVLQKQKEWGIRYVFAKAEEAESLQRLQAQIPNLLYTDTVRVSKSDTKTLLDDPSKKKSRYELLLDYVTDIYLLSQCDALIGTLNNGLYAALLWNNDQYRHVEIIDKGKYN